MRQAKNHNAKQYNVPLDVRYSVRVNYHASYDCESWGCNEAPICRCRMIEDAEVKSVDIGNLVNDLLPGKKGSGGEFLRYCTDRLTRIYGLYDPKFYEIDICAGYYGQEISMVRLRNPEFENSMRTLVSMNGQEMVEYVLTKEYGFLPPDLNERGKEFRLVRVRVDQLSTPNESYMSKMSGSYDFCDKNIPIGVYKKSNAMRRSRTAYDLVDGYHRLSSVRKSNKRKVNIISYE